VGKRITILLGECGLRNLQHQNGKSKYAKKNNVGATYEWQVMPDVCIILLVLVLIGNSQNVSHMSHYPPSMSFLDTSPVLVQ